MGTWTVRRCAVAVMVAMVLFVPSFRPGGEAQAGTAGSPIPVSLASYFDNVGIGVRPGNADFDGSGHAYPASALPAPGTISLGGVSYLFPGRGEDNMVARGQTIGFAPGHYSLAYLLVASSYGEAGGRATIHYTDGSATLAAINAPDWYAIGEAGLISTPYRYSRTQTERHVVSMFAERLWLDPSRTALSLTLPGASSGAASVTHQPGRGVPSIHLFALSLQPVVPGIAVKLIDARPTLKRMQGASQVVEVTVENIGTQWYTSNHPTTVTVDATPPSGGASVMLTSAPAVITDLAPGEQIRVEIGIQKARPLPDGTRLTASVVAHTSTGDSDTLGITLTAGIPDYTATAQSLSRHQAPDWFDAAKFGIFIHYGVYSIPAWAPVGGVYAEWYWHSMQQKGSPTYRHQLTTYGASSVYDDFIPRFTAGRFDARAWVELFKQAGARYFVFVTKHHDGFALFHTRLSHRNAVDMGPHKDLVRLLFDAARRYTPEIHPGVYYSLPEWYNPAFHGTRHKRNHFPGGPPTHYVTGKVIPYKGYVPVRNYVRDFQVPQMMELIDQYHPDILWCDIGGPNDSLKVIAHFFNQAQHGAQPREVAVDNRCGVPVHDFTTPEYRTYPMTVTAKWEDSRGIDPHSYGYNANTPDSAYATAEQLVHQLVDVVSKNGNFLLDIGPRADGTIPAIMEERLRQIGAWLQINGQAIYDTTYWWRTPEDGNLRFTVRPEQAFYITSLSRPDSRLEVHEPVPIRQGDKITLLGWQGSPLRWTEESGQLVIDIPPRAQQSGQYAWVFKIARANR